MHGHIGALAGGRESCGTRSLIWLLGTDAYFTFMIQGSKGVIYTATPDIPRSKEVQGLDIKSKNEKEGIDADRCLRRYNNSQHDWFGIGRGRH